MNPPDAHLQAHSQLQWLQLHHGEKVRDSGMGWVIAGLVLFFLVAIRKLLYIWGLHLPLRLISQTGNSTAFLVILFGMWQINRHQGRWVRPGFLVKVRFWQGLLVVLCAYGVLRGNFVAEAGKELILLWFFAAVWIIGANDRFWYAMEKPLTVMFYLAVPLIFLYLKVPAPLTTYQGTTASNLNYIGARYIGTLGFSFRPLIGAGMFLGVWGMIRPGGGKWRVFQIGAFFLAFILDAGVFKFRGAAAFYGLAVISFLILRPFLEYRRRPKMTVLLIVVAVVGMFIFFQTDAGQRLLWRFAGGASHAPILASRLNELHVYLSQMGGQVLIGRGLGGTYNAYAVYGIPAAYYWKTTHFGLLVFTLLGGVVMLGLFLAMLLPGLILRPKQWYQNPCNLAAALLFPVLLAQFTLDPLGLAPKSLLTYLPAMMVLARYGRPVELDTGPGVQT